MSDLSNPATLLKIISQSEVATAIYETDDIIIRYANPAMRAFWGKDESIIGMPLEDAVPELRGQPFKKMLQKVLETGITDEGVIQATTRVNDVLQTAWYDYQYKSLIDENGIPYCIVHTAADVTQLQLAEQEKQRLNDNLAAVNEELAASNEELRLANDELLSAQEELKNTFSQLEENTIALRLAIEAADFGTWHIHSVTRNFITSPRLRELFGYKAEEHITIDDALSRITDEYRDYVSEALENAIYNGGDYDVTYPVIGYHDQKYRWLRAIGNLQAHESGTFAAFTGVVMDVTELKRNEERKDDFIGMVSHELKTPLTSLNAYLQLMQLKALKAEDHFTANSLSRGLKQVKRMTTMINGFLNISRLESGKIHIEKKKFDMADLLREIQEESREIHPTHIINFQPAEAAQVLADMDKIGQVITNLISNAAKYSPDDSVIDISLSTVDGKATISVADHGMGISEQEIPKLFERYYRVENNSQIAGFGIGLYLCSEIVDRHDGRIWAESEPGKGSVFSFSIPLS